MWSRLKRMVTKPEDSLGGSVPAVQHEVDLSSATTGRKRSVEEKGVSQRSLQLGAFPGLFLCPLEARVVHCCVTLPSLGFSGENGV